MKVKELIKQLEGYDPEARVYYGSHMGKGDAEILTAFRFSHNGDVILEDAYQFDVENELREMLEWYADENYDEADAYQEMVDRGYTPEVVAIYLSEEKGKAMKEYCDSHGIA